MENIFIAANKGILDVLEDAFGQIQGGEGFDYTIGHIKGGKLKIVFEPDDTNCFDSVVIDGVDSFEYCLVGETEG